MIEYNNCIASTMLLTIGNAPKKIMKTIFFGLLFFVIFLSFFRTFYELFNRAMLMYKSISQ